MGYEVAAYVVGVLLKAGHLQHREKGVIIMVITDEQMYKLVGLNYKARMRIMAVESARMALVNDRKVNAAYPQLIELARDNYEFQNEAAVAILMDYVSLSEGIVG